MNDSTPSMLHPRVLVPFMLTGTIWGSTWFVITGQIEGVPPAWGVFYRFLLATPAMFLLAVATGKSLRLGKQGQMLAIGVGIAQFCGNFLFVYHAEQHITSGIVAVMFALLVWSGQSRPDRIAGMYPLIFAAGGVLVGEWARRRRWVRWGLPVWLAAWGAVLLPIGTPLLSPEATSDHLARLGIEIQTERGEGKRTALPQYFADRLGWPALIDDVVAVRDSLPERERARVQRVGELLVVLRDDAGAGAAGPVELDELDVEQRGDLRHRTVQLRGESPADAAGPIGDLHWFGLLSAGRWLPAASAWTACAAAPSPSGSSSSPTT